MTTLEIPEKLAGLYIGEEQLREKAIKLITDDKKFFLHLHIVQHAMNLADTLRQYETEDEDLKVIQVLSMRIFNAFGASVKLALSGYSQNSALILRDILETVFLLDFFKRDTSKIIQWRVANDKQRRQQFRPVKIRTALDKQDGFKCKKRAEYYKLFSELAGHPTMKSDLMMRPQKDGDAVIGPFMEKTTLEAVLSEMGKLAVQAGGILDGFFLKEWAKSLPERLAFEEVKREWIVTFYS